MSFAKGDNVLFDVNTKMIIDEIIVPGKKYFVRYSCQGTIYLVVNHDQLAADPSPREDISPWPSPHHFGAYKIGDYVTWDHYVFSPDYTDTMGGVVKAFYLENIDDVWVLIYTGVADTPTQTIKYSELDHY
jgi:hypothetical protein